MTLEEAHKNDQKAGKALLREAKKIGAIQSGAEKAPWRLYCRLSVFKEGLQERSGKTFYQGT